MSERLISADKLMQHILDNWQMERHAGTDDSRIRAEVWAELNDSLQSGMFEPTPVQQGTIDVAKFIEWLNSPDSEYFRIGNDGMNEYNIYDVLVDKIKSGDLQVSANGN
ncbi:hypothetical protein M2444_005385 [Paenibacillus sp. PastF-3]|uniref:hypothetical protein n=1 Tax=Paenibacillus sp. PastF-3 TaxID=2940626 RepID=UPI0024759E8A|nr:hypothetical protein [Paenibacillus sp. PastF-3]MDH6373553.1 hypothetical protein [Paenibacillus sp. PastF-3]